MSISEDQSKYLIEEMKLLRSEVELRGQEHRNMEKYVILGDAAIYTFLLSKGEVSDSFKELASYAWYIPPVFAALAYFRWFESIRMIERLARYLQIRERSLLPDDMGWESFLNGERLKTNSSMTPEPYIAFWSLLIAAPMAAAWVEKPLFNSNAGLVAAILGFGLACLVLWHLKRMERHWNALRSGVPTSSRSTQKVDS